MGIHASLYLPRARAVKRSAPTSQPILKPFAQLTPRLRHISLSRQQTPNLLRRTYHDPKEAPEQGTLTRSYNMIGHRPYGLSLHVFNVFFVIDIM